MITIRLVQKDSNNGFVVDEMAFTEQGHFVEWTLLCKLSGETFRSTSLKTNKSYVNIHSIPDTPALPRI